MKIVIVGDGESTPPHAGSASALFISVASRIDPRVETPEQGRDGGRAAAQYIPVEQLGARDDCGLSPFGDDPSMTPDMAFEKIRSQLLGTLAGKAIGAN